MKIYWLNGGLRIEPETEGEFPKVTALETAIRALADARIADPVDAKGFSCVELDHAALGSSIKER